MKDPSYQLAFRDLDFLGREDLRPLRLELELLKPEIMLEEKGIKSTIVAFGGTQIVPREQAERHLADAKKAIKEKGETHETKRGLIRATQLLAKTRFYDECREFAQIVSTWARKHDRTGEFVIKTGGGPGIMEAANRGAADVDMPSIGLNIILPFEQVPNSYITPGLCFQFNYFAIRKMHFLLRAEALICFPGGFGTLDELFTALTLRQTDRAQKIPIILYSREYWKNVINFEFLADEGVIHDEHLDLISYADSPQETWDLILDSYSKRKSA
jgi:uncharacterized protein (TIGR00730 family)